MWPSLTKFWKEILILLLFGIIFSLWYHDHSSLIEAMEISNKSHQEQLSIAQESLQREIEKKDALTKEYLENIEKIKSDFESTKDELERLRQDRKGQIINDRTERPEEVARLIEDAFGFTYVE